MTMTRTVKTLLAICCLGLGATTPVAAQEVLTSAPADEAGLVKVDVSFLLVDVMGVYDAEQEISADLFYRLNWSDPRLASEEPESRFLKMDSIWAPNFQSTSDRGADEMLPRVVIVDRDGNATYTQRLTGRFGAPTYLADFPFDRHEISFPFFFATSQGVIEYEVNAGPIVEISTLLATPDWKIEGGTISTEPLPISAALPPVPGATFTIEATRITSHYIWNTILPLIVIVMMSWTVFWAPPAQIAVQFGFSATSILTVIAYRFALANQVPPLAYSTRLDAFLNGAFILSFFALVEVIITARLIYRERVDAAERVDLHARWVFPLLLAAVAGRAFFF